MNELYYFRKFLTDKKIFNLKWSYNGSVFFGFSNYADKIEVDKYIEDTNLKAAWNDRILEIEIFNFEDRYGYTDS